MFARIGCVDHDNTMHMIGHHHECIRDHRREFVRQFCPPMLDHITSIIQNHLAIPNTPEETQSALHTTGHKICAYLRVIIPLQPNGTSVVKIRIVRRCSVPLASTLFNSTPRDWQQRYGCAPHRPTASRACLICSRTASGAVAPATRRAAAERAMSNTAGVSSPKAGLIAR